MLPKIVWKSSIVCSIQQSTKKLPNKEIVLSLVYLFTPII